VELKLHTDRERVGENPSRQIAAGERFVDGREVNRRRAAESVLSDDLGRPFVIGAIRDHEFQLITFAKRSKIVPAIALGLPAARALSRPRCA
jgi:hypothetical protein